MGPPAPALAHERLPDRGRSRVLGILRLVLTFLAVLLLVVYAEPTPASLSAGIPFLVLGAALRAWAAGHLRKTAELVTSGPYRWVRHPLYLGRLAIFTGLCIAVALPGGGSAIALVAGYALFFGYYLPRKERVEPARLAALHGDAYLRYHAAVPALLPARRPWPGGRAGWSRERWLRNREPWMEAGLAVVVAWLAWKAFSAAPGSGSSRAQGHATPEASISASRPAT